VFQQHTHLADDVMFSTSEYSYRYTPRQFEVLMGRTLDDIVTRFHTPYGVNIHPSNWARFSRPQGEAILRQAAERGLPVWSWDQWSVFWDARHTWRYPQVDWQDPVLRLTAEGEATDDRLRLAVPLRFGDRSLTGIIVNGEAAPYHTVERYHQSLGLVAFADHGRTAKITAHYV